MSTDERPLEAVVTGRIRSLDGLRGLAAVQVMLSHVFLANLDMDRAFWTTLRVEPDADVPIWAWIMHRSPLALLHASAEAVFLFFVLSGVVLCLHGPRPGPSWEVLTHWSRWLAARVVRLYVPVWALVGFAVSLAAVFGSGWVDGGGPWLGIMSTRDVSIGGIVEDLLLFPYPGNTSVQLWTMKWEVLFSFSVPVVLTLALRRPTRFVAVVVALVPVGIHVGSERLDGYPHYMAMFLAGSALAVGLFRPRGTGVAQVSFWWAWLVVALMLFMARWVTASGMPFDRVSLETATALSVLGCCGLIVLAVRAAPLRSLLETTPLQWLGSRSFALYLVHLPVVIASAGVTGGWSPVGAVISVCLSLLLAEVFVRLVEGPALSLSRRLRAT